MEQIQNRTIDVPKPCQTEIEGMVRSVKQVGKLVHPIVVREVAST